MIKEGLKLIPGTVVIPFSAETKQGREEIWELMDTYLEVDTAE
jgi:GTP-binding protein